MLGGCRDIAHIQQERDEILYLHIFAGNQPSAQYGNDHRRQIDKELGALINNALRAVDRFAAPEESVALPDKACCGVFFRRKSLHLSLIHISARSGSTTS